jgi:hypothetical protein
VRPRLFVEISCKQARFSCCLGECQPDKEVGGAWVIRYQLDAGPKLDWTRLGHGDFVPLPKTVVPRAPSYLRTGTGMMATAKANKGSAMLAYQGWYQVVVPNQPPIAKT